MLLTGASKTGKASIFKEAFRNAGYISLADPLVRLSAKEGPSIFFDQYKPPIIVSGIQSAGELFIYIKCLVDASKAKGQFFLTSTQSFKDIKNVSDSLAGRIGILKLLGLSSREIDGASYCKPFLPVIRHIEEMKAISPELDANKIAGRIHKGFYPELYETESSLKGWADFYSAYFQSYLERDMHMMLDTKDEPAFIKFVKLAAFLTGETLDYINIARICGKDVKTIESWLHILESSGLIYLLNPYSSIHMKAFAKGPKAYFLDTGLICWLLGLATPEALISSGMWGQIFKSFVFCEILKSYYNDGIAKPPLSYYRDKDKNEIDLVIEEGGYIYPVLFKASSSPVESIAYAFRCLSGPLDIKIGGGAVICLAKHPFRFSGDNWILPANLI